MATAALVLGIIAIVFSFIPFVNTVSLVLAIVSLGLAIPALSKARKVKVGLGRTIAALILGVASIGAFVVVNAATVVAIDEAVSEVTTAEDAVDVTFGERSTEYGSTTVEVTVEHVSDSTESPMITVVATSADGPEQYDISRVIVSALKPGQQATEEAFFADELPADAVLTVSDVL